MGSVDWRVVDEYMSCHSLFPGVALSQKAIVFTCDSFQKKLRIQRIHTNLHTRNEDVYFSRFLQSTPKVQACLSGGTVCGQDISHNPVYVRQLRQYLSGYHRN